MGTVGVVYGVSGLAKSHRPSLRLSQTQATQPTKERERELAKSSNLAYLALRALLLVRAVLAPAMTTHEISKLLGVLGHTLSGCKHLHLVLEQAHHVGASPVRRLRTARGASAGDRMERGSC
eukprot:5669234-Pleurochrysis_carterae.AAC.2